MQKYGDTSIKPKVCKEIIQKEQKVNGANDAKSKFQTLPLRDWRQYFRLKVS